MVVLLVATPEEARAARPLLAGAEEVSLPGNLRALRGGTAAGDTLVAAVGVGKVAAASATAVLCHLFTPRLLLVCGVAGALDETLEVGDLVISTELVPADTGLIHSGGFKTTGPGICGPRSTVFQPSFTSPPRLVEKARLASASARLKHHAGRTITCDQAVLDPELRLHLGRLFRALAVDMEGAAAAQVASAWRVPFLSVRAVSDAVSFDGAGLEELLPRAGEKRWSMWGRRFLLSLRGAEVLARARLLRKGSEAALRNLESFLREFLKEPL